MTKRIRARVVALSVGVFLVLFAASAPAGAAKKPITGKLSKRGYTVIALAANGKAKSVRAKPKFKLRPPAKRVTLHLRGQNGKYAGPIVVGRKKQGKRAILGIKAGAKLGKVKVKAGKGYAKPKRKLAKKFVDAKRKARAKNGIPLGAGSFGRVTSKNAKGGAPGDRDLDGVADLLDIDDDGDLLLDSFDSSGAARFAQADPTPLPTTHLGSDLTLRLDQTTNVNALTAAGSTPQQINDGIDTALRTYSRLAMVILPGDSAELDCGGSNQQPPRPEGLVYCSLGGTGRLFNAPMPEFPECCDSGLPGDPDGFGTMVNAPGFQPPGTMFLLHGAGIAEIGTGDILIERVTTGGSESHFAATLQFVFATAPALVSYSDTAGNSGNVTYPVAQNGPGTQGNGFPVSAPGGQDVVLTFTLWRPQRTTIARDPGSGFVDMGNLKYTVLAGGGDCPQEAFSSAVDNPTGAPLAPAPPSLEHGGGFVDSAGDRVPSSANTITFTLNLTQCLASKGQAATFDQPGEEAQLSIFGYAGDTGQDNAQQPVFFERQ